VFVYRRLETGDGRAKLRRRQPVWTSARNQYPSLRFDAVSSSGSPGERSGVRPCGPSPTLASLRSVVGDRKDAETWVAALLELEHLGISGPAAANWLRTVGRVAVRTRKPDLVWSGFHVPGLHARETSQPRFKRCCPRGTWNTLRGHLAKYVCRLGLSTRSFIRFE
jgi:hypothetical protein